MLSEKSNLMFGVGSWFVSSIGMMLFNKLAVKAFPVECCLVALQMAVTVVVMVVCCFRSIHIGSFKDVLRWSMVVPFYTGMLLSSILALKYAPMTLVVVFRVLSPLVSLGIERLYPDPLRISKEMVGSVLLMFAGAACYVAQMPRSNMAGIGYVFLNVFFAVGDRCLQRLMLAKDQSPVDISKTGVTLLNNLEGMVPLIVVAAIKNEFVEIPAAFRALDGLGATWVILSCVVGVSISYCGIWAQSMISATSFLVLVNVNKFVIIFVEAYVMKSKTLTPLQIVGACITIVGGVCYGQARGMLEAETQAKVAKSSETNEKTPLIAKQV